MNRVLTAVTQGVKALAKSNQASTEVDTGLNERQRRSDERKAAAAVDEARRAARAIDEALDSLNRAANAGREEEKVALAAATAAAQEAARPPSTAAPG